MSLHKIPFIVATLAGAHITYTPPASPALEEERRPELVRLSRLPLSIKAIYWALALAEVAAILANNAPGSAFPVSRRVLEMLFPEQNADELRIVSQSAIGALLSLCGGVIRLVCYRWMGRHFTFDVAILKHHKLVTNGPYSIVRHPSYSGAIMVFIGSCMFHMSPGSLLWESKILSTTLGWCCVGLAFAIVSTIMIFIPHRMHLEDAGLRREFGRDWDEWAKRVPHWIVPGVY